MDALTHFPPTRTAALERLSDFVPRAGRSYARDRNTDAGPGAHSGVSTLSPYLRCRVLTEPEVLKTVRGRHSDHAAEKFIQEVFWRTYWKGWLEMRPGVWSQYQIQLTRDWDGVQTQSGLRARWEDACTGETGIACFDAWARELVTTGYLHNHARMWFASIWIFTLNLPWTLGADFFLRHLLDGDAASNTLGWRWVAGIQTPGKTYLARPSNIAKFTSGRFFVPQGQLAQDAPAQGAPVPPDPQPLAPPELPDPTARTGFLLHDDDLSPGFALDAAPAPVAAARLAPQVQVGPLCPAPHVAAFRTTVSEDAATRWQARLGGAPEVCPDADHLFEWAARENLAQIVTPWAPVGATATLLERIAASPDAPRLVRLRRGYDSDSWPHATKGFFPFKKKIPALLTSLE